MSLREINRLSHRKNLLFVNKKKQKNFVNLALVCSDPSNVHSDPFEQKSFASFFQRRCFLPLLQPIDFTRIPAHA